LKKIAIASGKGGTGKTTLAANLARRAAETRPVALLDLDVEEPNSGIFIKGEEIERRELFRLVPNWDKESCLLCGKCVEVCKYNAVLKLGNRILVLPELCHSCHACSELCPAGSLPMEKLLLGQLTLLQDGKLDFIESKLEVGVEMASPLIHQTLELAPGLCPEAELQLRDCPPGTACSVINATKDADLILLVTEPTPFGLHDLDLAVQTMRHLNKPMAVAVNRQESGNDTVQRYCDSQGLEIWAVFPNQRGIAELYSRGELIYPKVEEFREQLDGLLKRLDAWEAGR